MATETAQDRTAHAEAEKKTPHVRVTIVGTGFSGLGLAIKLKQRGMENFVILERANDIGGTWRDNIYPGCACDVPSHLYSFSFAPNPDWSRHFSPQREIWRLPARLRRALRPDAAYPPRPRTAGGHVGRGRQPLAHPDEPVVVHRRRPRARQWTAQRAVHPGDSRYRALRGRRLSLGAVGPRT